ncbi:MAG: ribonuclease HI [Firmicutes bacterium]|nr:ribonuclease HI [Bacillota bacterium]
MKEVIIYTDGACSGNPGPGGWGAVLLFGPHIKEISGYEPDTTNNRMELMAAIRALNTLKEPCSATLHSDSAYLINTFQQGWLTKWQLNGWKTSNKGPVENQDLWRELLELTAKHSVKWVKVKGHSDNEYNNRCDKLAREEIKKAAKEAD